MSTRTSPKFSGRRVVGILIVAMFFLARAWSSVRQLSPRWRRALYGGLGAVLVGVFLFGPSH